MSVQFDAHEAKAHFAALLERVMAGEEIVISRAGMPVARLAPLDSANRTERVPGSQWGGMWMADDFDEPLPADFLGGGVP